MTTEEQGMSALHFMRGFSFILIHHNLQCFVLYRLLRLWEEEVANVCLEKASLVRMMLRFLRTRLILVIIIGVVAMVAVFLGPVIFFSNNHPIY